MCQLFPDVPHHLVPSSPPPLSPPLRPLSLTKTPSLVGLHWLLSTNVCCMVVYKLYVPCTDYLYNCIKPHI